MQRLVTEIEGCRPWRCKTYRTAPRGLRDASDPLRLCVSRIVVVALRRHVGQDCREAFTCLGPFWISTNLHMPLTVGRLAVFSDRPIPNSPGAQ